MELGCTRAQKHSWNTQGIMINSLCSSCLVCLTCRAARQYDLSQVDDGARAKLPGGAGHVGDSIWEGVSGQADDTSMGV